MARSPWVALGVGIVLCGLATTAWIIVRGVPHPAVPSDRESLEGRSEGVAFGETAGGSLEGGTTARVEMSEVREVAGPDREEVRPTLVRIEDMAKEDAERLKKVNAILANAQLPTIPSDAGVAVGDMDDFRSIVDAANSDVRKSLGAWRSVANRETRVLERKLVEDIRNGKEDLPLQSKENPMRRRHPYEAITQFMYDGKSYVLRASVQDVPELLAEGEKVDETTKARIMHFDTLVRGLFVSQTK